MSEIKRIHFNKIDSTNTWGKQNAISFERDKVTLITADEQTSGRGRFKRKWESPPGQNIYATFCFFTQKTLAAVGEVSTLAAQAVAKTLEAHGLKPLLKHPNDVMLSGKKVSGILCETTSLDLLCVIVGIGLNVNMPVEALEKIDQPATSLLAESGFTYDIESLLKSLQKYFVSYLKKSDFI
jgi:BirA family biotin operon repressor/biotin-[acetyl-CoA-carboxylase] ligase